MCSTTTKPYTDHACGRIDNHICDMPNEYLAGQFPSNTVTASFYYDGVSHHILKDSYGGKYITRGLVVDQLDHDTYPIPRRSSLRDAANFYDEERGRLARLRGRLARLQDGAMLADILERNDE